MSISITIHLFKSQQYVGVTSDFRYDEERVTTSTADNTLLAGASSLAYVALPC